MKPMFYKNVRDFVHENREIFNSSKHKKKKKVN